MGLLCLIPSFVVLPTHRQGRVTVTRKVHILVFAGSNPAPAIRKSMTKSEVFDTCFEKDISKEKALDIYKTAFWENAEWDPVELAYLQFHQGKLIMPFDVWMEATSTAIGHPVLNIFYSVPENKNEVIRAYKKKYGRLVANTK